jgi:hypothetical protein
MLGFTQRKVYEKNSRNTNGEKGSSIGKTTTKIKNKKEKKEKTYTCTKV